jgi:hypothetical protein
MDAIAKASRPGERDGRIKAAFATFAILLALSLLGNVGCSPSSAGVSGSDGVAKEESTDYLLKFVDEYNAIAKTKITPGERFSPHDKESPYYRTEFRLGAYNESLGLAATCGDVSILIVNYGKQNEYSSGNNDFRVYASGPADQVTAFYRVSAKVLDPSVSDDAIEDVIGNASEHGENGGKIRGSSINPTNLILRPNGVSETMLDTGKYVRH